MKKTIRFISLGCPKNLVDSEVMLGILTKRGYQLVGDNERADIFIVNTCSFIKEAVAESEEIIQQAIKLKQEGKYQKIIVAGCLPQRVAKLLRVKYQDQIDGLMGIFNREEVVKVCEGKKVSIKVPPSTVRCDRGRFLVTPAHYSYLRIAEGCDNHCTYCIIPHLHGRFRSKPLKEVIKEATFLAKKGVKELNIIAQDTTAYGKDLTGKFQLSDLLEAISKIPEINWIRLLYTHPKHFTDDLIETIARNDKIVKYLDMPVQHISNKVLKMMGRGITSDEIRDLIRRLRNRIPDLFLRTSVIVGFPGEDEQDFAELLKFLKEVRFERLGAFKYSREDGSPAASFPNQISEKIKNQRLDMVMRLQQQIAFEINNDLIGKCLPVIIDAQTDNQYIGRTYGDAPEVDGNIFIDKTNIRLQVGQIYKVLITGSVNYDLKGIVV